MAMSAQKRKAEDELQSEQRLTKRFDLLNLDHNGKLYIPVQRNKGDGQPRRGHSNEESMQVDDTKDRVYIHNLDDELCDIESEEEKIVFLPDIDKKLGKIPKSVLLSESHPSVRNEMVLYNVPTSLSIPKEHDSVRKAIIESRARARAKQVNDAAESEVVSGRSPVATPPAIATGGEDDDAMNIG